MILRELVQALVQDSPTKGYVFILGDLNYRITMDPVQVYHIYNYYYHSIFLTISVFNPLCWEQVKDKMNPIAHYSTMIN